MQAERNDVARMPLTPPSIAPSPMRTNWCTADLTAEEDKVADRHMTAEHRVVGKGHALPTWQSCADVRTHHEEAAIANRR